MREFDVCGPLPEGVTVLEASAGTGKTYAIAALAARYVADGVPLEELLLVTFTRMATGELRERVRERLVHVEAGLQAAAAGEPLPDDDEVTAFIASTDVERRLAHVTRALADFDAATIETTHGFCLEVLAGLGVAGDVERDFSFVEDTRDLVQEVVDDLYVRKWVRSERAPDFPLVEARQVVDAAIANPDAPLEPTDAGPDDIEAVRLSLAKAARAEFDVRKRRARVLSFDDLLTRLKATLEGEDGDVAAARMRERFSVVLVDEFQDTDPTQWEIMRRAFGGGGSTLVLIGDPKQAIYAFRGADVYAYLAARGDATDPQTLAVNHRSDSGLIEALDRLFDGAQLGHPGIVHRPVKARHEGSRLHDSVDDTPLRLRWVDREDVGTTRKVAAAKAAPARDWIARDVGAQVVDLLQSGARVDGEPVAPKHVAVLVQTNRGAAAIREALDAVGVPAVINGAGSVFATEAAGAWLRLLEALERPTSSSRARGAVLTAFFGWSAARVAEATEDEWAAVHRRLHDWARVLRDRGVAALAETATLVEGLPGRVLARADGERVLTDLRHVAQLLHGAAVHEAHVGATALLAWLRRRIGEAATEGDEERSRRLESDAEAVQVLTVHRSKGLEFPIVLYPALWDPSYIPEGVPVAFHDQGRGDARVVDVGLGGPSWDEHVEQHVIEERGEDLRLAYVALTRARHQAIVWWAGTWDARNGPLSRLVFDRDPHGGIPWQVDALPSDADAVLAFEALAAAAPGCVAVERSVLPTALPTYAPAADPVGELAAATWDRRLDRAWRRTSYSGITAAAHDARVASEPEADGPVVDDEPESADPMPSASSSAGDGMPSKLGAMPVGARVGTFIHAVLETTDFAAGDLDVELGTRVSEQLAWRPVGVGDPAAVVAGLRAAIETPMAGLPPLRSFGRRDRLDELSFELPLVGGDAPAGALDVGAIARVLRDGTEPSDPLHTYADQLDDPVLRSDLRGYLIGFLDLVLRVRGDDGVDRYVVVDHKTNWLAGFDEELTTWHYRPEALQAEVERSHYVLQALLYTVALHRFLRWRVPGYSPDEHLLGVRYLFLRGMVGPSTPEVDGAPCGVWSWRPSGALVEALSDALDGPGSAPAAASPAAAPAQAAAPVAPAQAAEPTEGAIPAPAQADAPGQAAPPAEPDGPEQLPLLEGF